MKRRARLGNTSVNGGKGSVGDPRYDLCMLSPEAWISVGTLVLAAATVALAWVTVTTGKADRRHDDAKRAEDRARDDRLRQEQLDQLERQA